MRRQSRNTNRNIKRLVGPFVTQRENLVCNCCVNSVCVFDICISSECSLDESPCRYEIDSQDQSVNYYDM